MQDRPSPPVEQITERHLEVARLIADGRTNPEIAEALGISLAGAKYHVSELLGRLGLERREEIAAWYRTHRGTPITRARRRLGAIGLAPLAWAGGGGAAVVLAAIVVVVALDRADGYMPGGAPDAGGAVVLSEDISEGPPYRDPFAYCRAMGTVDDWFGDRLIIREQYPPALIEGLVEAIAAGGPETSPQLDSAEYIGLPIHWRCLDGAVIACLGGGPDTPCGKPPDGIATTQLDGQGFIADNWHEVPPPPVRTVHAYDARTGIASIDPFVDAVVRGDVAALESAVSYTRMSCVETSGAFPPCRQDEEVGSAVDVFTVIDLRRLFLRTDQEPLRRWLQAEDPSLQDLIEQGAFRLYAVASMPVYERGYWPRAEHFLVFTDGTDVVGLPVGDGNLYGIVYSPLYVRTPSGSEIDYLEWLEREYVPLDYVLPPLERAHIP